MSATEKIDINKHYKKITLGDLNTLAPMVIITLLYI